jgi:hypothetical protein
VKEAIRKRNYAQTQQQAVESRANSAEKELEEESMRRAGGAAVERGAYQ